MLEFVTMIGVILLVLISISIREKQKFILEQNKLFKVKNKLTGETFVVDSAKKEDSERTEFLIYTDNQWQWVLSDMYIPY